MSEGERLENISMRSSLESEKRGGDIVGEDCDHSRSGPSRRNRAPCMATVVTAVHAPTASDGHVELLVPCGLVTSSTARTPE
jgi:hypothetical protein